MFGRLGACLVWLLILASGNASAQRLQSVQGPGIERPDPYQVEWRTLRFQDYTLEEVNEFDGWSTSLDVAHPVGNHSALRLHMPLYSSGEATLVKPASDQQELKNSRIRIRGYSGVFDFYTLYYQNHKYSSDKNGFDLSWFAGAGDRVNNLETTHGDRFNHQGRIVHVGVNYARKHIDTGGTLFAGIGHRQYLMSDDLNPADTGDGFFHFDLNVGYQSGQRGRLSYSLEGLYQGDLTHYHGLYLTPSLNLRLRSGLEWKLSAQIGFGDHSTGPNLFSWLAWSP